MLCCAQPCQCVLSQPVANPRSRIIPWHRATFAQRQQRGLDHTNPGLLRSLQFFRSFYETELSLQSRAHFADLIFQKCSAAASFFNILKYECKSSFRHSPVPFLSTVFPHWGAEPRKCRNRDSTSATPEATLPEKNRVFRAQKRFTGELTHFQNCYSSLLLPHVSCYCSPCFCHDDRTIGLPPDIRHE